MASLRNGVLDVDIHTAQYIRAETGRVGFGEKKWASDLTFFSIFSDNITRCYLTFSVSPFDLDPTVLPCELTYKSYLPGRLASFLFPFSSCHSPFAA